MMIKDAFGRRLPQLRRLKMDEETRKILGDHESRIKALEGKPPKKEKQESDQKYKGTQWRN